MILTINLNPVLEKIYYIDKLLPRIETQAEKTLYKSSGSCINTTQILNNLNLDVLPIGFLGGLNGKFIYNDLSDQGIESEFIEIKDETQCSTNIIENGKFLCKITESKPRVTREELVSLYELYKHNINNYNIICGVALSPIGVPDEIYFDLISLSNSKDKKFLLDTSGINLKYGIDAKPYMVKLKVSDLEDLTNLQLNYENEIIKAANYILGKGIKLVIIDLNEKGSIVLNQERGYRLELNNLDIKSLNIDQGYILAGYAFGMEKDYDLEMTMKLGQAFRIAYGLAENIDDIDMSDIKKIMGNITIMPIFY